jgi:hypothetical protein
MQVREANLGRGEIIELDVCESLKHAVKKNEKFRRACVRSRALPVPDDSKGREPSARHEHGWMPSIPSPSYAPVKDNTDSIYDMFGTTYVLGCPRPSSARGLEYLWPYKFRDADRKPYDPYVRYRHTGAVYRTGGHLEV